MKYKILISKHSDKFLLKHKDIEDKIISIFENLKEEYFTKVKQYDIKKLKSIEDVYRLRVGKYRIVYKIIENELIIFIIEIDSRGQIYKSM